MTAIRSPVVRAIALVLMPAVLACTSWKATPVAPRALVEDSHPKVVRVTPLRRTSVTLWDPFVRGDSLVGRASWKGPETAAVPLDQVILVKTKRLDPLKTFGFATAATAAAVVLAAIVFWIDFAIRYDGQGIQ